VRAFRRFGAGLSILVVVGVLAPAALAVHWPFFGGDNGRSGYQPVDEGTVPVGFVYAKTAPTERFIKTSIVTTTGAPATQRLIFGTRDGFVNFQILATGAPVGPEAGTDVDEGAPDLDVFGTRDMDPGENGSSVSFADTSGATGLGQLFAVHNDDDATPGAPDIEVAQLDEFDGSLVAQVDVAGTEGYTIESSLVATGAAADGSRSLFFVATDGTNQKLFKVPVSNASARSAGIGAATATADIDATPFASPTIVFLDVGGTPTAHIAVGAAGALKTYRASDLGAGPAVAIAGDVQTPSVPVEPSGLTPSPSGTVKTAPFIYVASDTGGASTVSKVQPADNALTVTQTSDTLAGAPAPALAVDQESEPDIEEAKLIVTTGANLYLLSTADLGLAGQFSRAPRSPGSTGFAQTTAAASGELGYVTSDDATQYVFRLSDGKPVAGDEFTQADGNPPMANTGVGQPSLSRGFVQYSGGNGAFVYRNTDATDPTVSLTAPADGATVSGTVTFSATAFDARGIAKVDFRVNGRIVGTDNTPDAGAPFGAPGATYSAQVDTSGLANGDSFIDAVATDASGRMTTSAPRRITIRNAGGAADDRPPTVSFTAPAANALIRSSTTVSATAGDDNAIKSVAFFDDDRLICTDTTSPYSCTYSPRGDDVGRDTLFAVATDTADQIGTDVRTVRVDRFRPRSVTATTTPSRDRTAPYRFRTRGRVNLPANVTRGQACRAGRVAVTFKVVRKTISNRRVALRRDCRFVSRVTFRNPERLGRGRLRVSVRFLGNAVLKARSTKRRTVRAG